MGEEMGYNLSGEVGMSTGFDSKNRNISGDLPDAITDSNIEVTEETNKLDGWPRLSRRAFMRSSLLAASGAMVGSAPRAGGQQSAPASVPLRFGVNYIPRKNWLYSWQDWDLQSVKEDFDAIRDLGMDHIRAHCLWPLFQPGINYVSERLLNQMHQLLDAADQADLDVEVAVLDGWMSGFSFLPPWTQPLARSEDHNMFVGAEVIEGEKLLFKRLADTVGTHTRFLGFDLGNEMNVLLSRGNPATQDLLDAWTTEMFRYLESIAPGKFHVNGLGARPWWSDMPLARTSIANQGKATSVHTYAGFAGSLQRYGYNGIGTLHLPEYRVELAYAYQTDLARRVWVEEVGASPEWMPDTYLPEYARQLVHNAVDTGVLWGITWWCSHDIDPAIKGFKSLEYTLGLIDQQNHVKPLGGAFAALARELGGKSFPSTQRSIALVIPEGGLAPDPHPFDWTYATPFMNLVKQGKKPCIVLKNRVHDEDYLRARGVTQLVSLDDAAKV
jgi:Cellulase (glycosyl hydrolase family 5)